ncbi:hypothetical protein [Archangium primigenium]|uniref:hypothetical protein n=1 Tax=Melittangium TaxID=44 RepID=UPI00195D6951|nr:hypothetical protein [Archangium primigenium]MBM7117038.1 hypothetical protein [Archangium primigenium]
MSDGANHPQPPPSSTNPPRASSTTNPRVMSAARAAPPPKALPPGAVGKRLQDESANAALNALAIAKEMVQDFRQQDRFFKYKAFIVGGWLLLTIATVGVTCSRGVKETGEFGAKLVPAGRSALMFVNKSKEPWVDVTIVVKDFRGQEWRASVARVEPGKDVTITPKQLLGAQGQVAPSDIVIHGVEMRTADGRATLMENNKNLTVDEQH